MAFAQVYTMPQRWKHFDFYDSFANVAVSTASGLSVTLNHSVQWKLAEIRMHCSVAIASIADLIIWVSSAKGSAYNTKLVSQALLGVQDMFVHYSEPLIFESGDHLRFAGNASASTSNVIGIQCIGWAVTG